MHRFYGLCHVRADTGDKAGLRCVGWASIASSDLAEGDHSPPVGHSCSQGAINMHVNLLSLLEKRPMALDQLLIVYAIGMVLLGLVASLLVQLLTRLVATLLLAGMIFSAVVALGIVNMPEEILRAWGHTLGQFLGSVMLLLKGHGDTIWGFFEVLLRDKPQVGGSAFALGFLGGFILRQLRK